MPLDEPTLQGLDARGYEVIDLLTLGGRQSATYSNSNTFIGVDGHTYWVKATAQHGLVAELVAGRHPPRWRRPEIDPEIGTRHTVRLVAEIRQDLPVCAAVVGRWSGERQHGCETHGLPWSYPGAIPEPSSRPTRLV